jgi:hypothetical protein
MILSYIQMMKHNHKNLIFSAFIYEAQQERNNINKSWLLSFLHHLPYLLKYKTTSLHNLKFLGKYQYSH